MESLNLLTLWNIDDQEDSFFEIDFTVPIKRSNHLSNNNKIVMKPNNLQEVRISTLLMNAKHSNLQSKRFSNNVVSKYMKLIKPFYNKASRFKISDEFLVTEKKSPLREVCNQLRKSRSASAAFSSVAIGKERRDDSLLQQEDGIQSAILHCRRSYYSSRDIPRASKEEGQRRISI